MKIFLVTAFLTTILIIAIALGAQNEQLIVVNYLIAQAELRTSSLMAICFLVGVSVTLLFTLWQRLHFKLQLSKANKQLSVSAKGSHQ